jgi:translation initiation factor IF-2
MRYRKLSILAFCVAASIGFAAQAQSAADSSDDQAKVLEALRQAEHATPVEQPAKSKKKPAKKSKPIVAPVAPTAQQPIGLPASSSDEEARAWEALRKAEHGQAAPAMATPVVTAPAVTTPAATAPAAPITAPASSPDDESRALEALRQAEKPQHQNVQPSQTEANQVQNVQTRKEEEAIKAQQEADAKLHAEQERNEAAARLKEAEEAKKAAAAQARAAKIQEEADAKLKKEEEKKKLATDKAQEESARRADKLLQKEMNHPTAASAAAAPTSSATPLTGTKEQRLSDLLRRYEADEITPLQYHTERAKIIAEP